MGFRVFRCVSPSCSSLLLIGFFSAATERKKKRHAQWERTGNDRTGKEVTELTILDRPATCDTLEYLTVQWKRSRQSGITDERILRRKSKSVKGGWLPEGRTPLCRNSFIYLPSLRIWKWNWCGGRGRSARYVVNMHTASRQITRTNWGLPTVGCSPLCKNLKCWGGGVD